MCDDSDVSEIGVLFVSFHIHFNREAIGLTRSLAQSNKALVLMIAVGTILEIVSRVNEEEVDPEFISNVFQRVLDILARNDSKAIKNGMLSFVSSFASVIQTDFIGRMIESKKWNSGRSFWLFDR